MKLALVVPGGFDRSGRERVIPALLWLIERLARRHEVWGITLHQYPQPGQYPLLGATILNLGEAAGHLVGLRLWTRLWRMLAAFRAAAWKPDVLHAFWAGESGLLAVLAGRLLSIPVVVSLGGGELVWLPEIGYGGQGSWRSRVQIGWSLRGAQAVTAGSQYALGPLGRLCPRALWVPLGVDAALFNGSTRRPAGPPWRLLHVGSINRVKDPFLLLQALRQVVERLPQVRLDWVGEDTLGGQVQALAHELGLGDHVHFHGFRPLDEIIPLYRQAHLYVQSSHHESQGVAVCEAAAAGVPSVGTAVGLVAELAPELAVAVPAGDAGALAHAILELLADTPRREALGLAAQSWARLHDAGWTAAQFEALYQQVRSRS